MNAILHLLSVNTIFFTVFGYPLSYVEFFGTIFNLWSVWLVARKNIWNWPIGIIGVILFFALFYQIHLYADQFEQVYYFVTGFGGWYLWARNRNANHAKTDDDLHVERTSKKANLFWLLGIAVFSVIATWILMNINVWLPKFFPDPAALPFIDATTTVMSFAATILMMQRKVECWYLWIGVDVVAVWLYWYKHIPFVAGLYAIFLVLAVQGLITWRNTFNAQEKDDEKGTRNREILPATQRT